jgi:predicted amidophosphoribosyltransferase
MPISICQACLLPARSVVTNLPCEDCLSSLLVSPAICPECLGLACSTGECERPWLRITGKDDELRFASVDAAYLSIGPGARVLKSWKKAPSPSLERYLLAEVREKAMHLAEGRPIALVPVPQNAKRRWELEGGSTLRLCSMILEARKNPDDEILEILEVSPNLALDPERISQAKSRGEERYSRRSAIIPGTEKSTRRVTRHRSPKRDSAVFLVDDFLTSGSTLRSALGATRKKIKALAELENLDEFGRFDTRIGVFVLGFRPTLFHSAVGNSSH